MLLLYLLSLEIPPETCDPETKERLLGLPLLLHVSGLIVRTLLELIIAIVAVDILFGGFFPSSSVVEQHSDAKDFMVAEYIVGTLLMTTPYICVLVSALIYGGFIVEV
jgi:hypothetical protein